MQPSGIQIQSISRTLRLIFGRFSLGASADFFSSPFMHQRFLKGVMTCLKRKNSGNLAKRQCGGNDPESGIFHDFDIQSALIPILYNSDVRDMNVLPVSYMPMLAKHVISDSDMNDTDLCSFSHYLLLLWFSNLPTYLVKSLSALKQLFKPENNSYGFFIILQISGVFYWSPDGA